MFYNKPNVQNSLQLQSNSSGERSLNVNGASQTSAKQCPEYNVCTGRQQVRPTFFKQRQEKLTCEGSGVDDDLRVEGVCVTKRIGQDEPPLSIRVIHLQRKGSKKRGGGAR